MIINTGNRTDIPAYYSEWFYKRIEEGVVMVRNPYHPLQVQSYRLSPEVVDCLVFCTKNPSPMFPKLELLAKYHQYWFVTITAYGADIEPKVPPKEKVMEDFLWLSKRVGRKAMSWRYDPIFINDRYSLTHHIKTFEMMCQTLQGATDHCIISFVDLYQKTMRNFPSVKAVTMEEQKTIAKEFVEIGRQYGIRIKSCCEGEWLRDYNIDTSGCLTQEVLERAIGQTLHLPKKKPAREGCNCLLANDIGAYNTCGHGCFYCYANYNQNVVAENQKKHDKNSLILVGQLHDEDIIKESKQESYLDGQLNLFQYENDSIL